MRYCAEIVFGNLSAKGRAAKNGIEQRLVFGPPVSERNEDGRFALSDQTFRNLKQRRGLAHSGRRDEDQVAKLTQGARECRSQYWRVQLCHLHGQRHIRRRPFIGAPKDFDIGGGRRMKALRKFTMQYVGWPHDGIV